MTRKRKPKHQPGAIYRCPETGGWLRCNDRGEEEPWEPEPWDPDHESAPDPLGHIPRRPDGSIAPFYALGHHDLERLGQDTPRKTSPRRTRHDGWTVERQKDFIETLAATASVSDACRYVGLSRQSAHKLYGRSPQFRAAWDDALKAAVGVLAATAFDRAVNGTQEQVWHDGAMVGFREKHHDRLLMYLLRVRDPLNFAPLDDLAGWQRHRALDHQAADMVPALDRLEAAERHWQGAAHEPRQLTAPADQLAPPPPPPPHSLTAGAGAGAGAAAAPPALEPPAPDPATLSPSSTSRRPDPLPAARPGDPATASTSST